MPVDDDTAFARLVSLACHDLRTPLATIVGFARTLARIADLDPQAARWVGLIDGAAGELDALIDVLAIAARIERGDYDPPRNATPVADLVDAGTPEGVTHLDEGATRMALAALLRAAERHGKGTAPAWRANGRELLLGPLARDAVGIVAGDEQRDVGALVARRVLTALGATAELRGDDLVVALPD